MTLHDHAAAAHRNLIAVNARVGEGPGGKVVRNDGALLFASRSALPFLNGVIREPGGGDAESLLSEARDFFSGIGHGFVVYCWPGDPELEAAARAAGMFEAVPRYPEMVCEQPLPELNAELREVATEEEAVAYWQLCDAAYPSLGFPPGVFAEAFSPADLLDDRSVSAWIAWDGDRALACAVLFLAEDVGMVGWVAAQPEARGRGLAAACTTRVTNEAFARGAKLASLQASTMGEDLYRRLRYREIFSYRLLGAMPG